MPISIIRGYSYIANIAKQVGRHPNRQIRMYLLTYVEEVERAFIRGS